MADELPPPSILRTLHADRDPGAPYLVYGYTADQMRTYAQEAVLQEREKLEVLHRMKYHGRLDDEGVYDWDLYPIDTDECKDCFEVLIVRSRSSATGEKG